MSNFMLVPLATVKSALHIDFTDDDVILTFYIKAASGKVIRYLNGAAGEVLSIDSPPDSPPDNLDDVPADIAQAVIILTGIWYRNPDQDTDGNFVDGELPGPVKSLLYDYRNLSLA